MLDDVAINATDTYRAAWVNRDTGELHITSTTAPDHWNAGFAADIDGRLCVSMGGTISHFIAGLPVTFDGRVVGQTGQTPLATDPFIAGIRVGDAGVYLL